MPAAASDPESHIAFILSALAKNDGELKINWNTAAAENGIGYGRNAATKFKDTLKKYGYKFEGNLIVKIDGETAPATPKTPKGGKVANGKGGSGSAKPSAKKRKVGDDGVGFGSRVDANAADDDEDGGRVKLEKGTKWEAIEIKDEDDDDDDDDDDGGVVVPSKDESDDEDVD